ncbi:TPM domain-containing protein, partial [Candidatus Saganbacteria bacterium]|nr:TPM domain-containing protein [Candidatus Saganbacteria bacterium]
KLFKEWKIGKAGKDNGILILLSTDEQRVEIEVGYGLEGTINDAKAGEIIDNYMLSFFKKGQFGEGLYNGMGAIADLIKTAESQESGTEESLGGQEKGPVGPGGGGGLWGGIAVVIIIILLLLLFAFTSGRFLGLIGIIIGGGVGFLTGGMIGAIIGAVIGFMLSYGGYSGRGGFGGWGGGMSGGWGGGDFGGGRSGGGGAGRNW